MHFPTSFNDRLQVISTTLSLTDENITGESKLL